MSDVITVADALTVAVQHHRSGRLPEAEALYRQVIAAEPQHADALHLLGVLAHETGHHEAAVRLIGRAIAVKDDTARYHSSLGDVLRALQRGPEARQSYCRAIEREPTLAAAHYGLGLLQYQDSDYAGAAESFRACVSHATNSADAHAKVGDALFQMGHLEDAVDWYRGALELNPGQASVHSNLGLALHDLGVLDEAIAHCERAVALKPDFAAAHNNLSLVLLLKGDFAAGLPHHEWRWQVSGLQIGERRFDQQAWRGEPLNGGRILLHAEQGAGDTLQFLRYAPMVAERGGRVIIEVQPELKRLAMSVQGVEEVIARGEAVPAFDLHCPFLSLPLAFGTTMASIPGGVPYIAPPASLRADWQARLAASSGLRVGLVWAGRPEQRRDPYRSIALSALAPLAATGATLFSLQKGPGAAQAKNPPPGMVLHNLDDSLGDFADTAAAMSALDLVITVCTSTAHLAGAMGKPVWVLLAYVADWRWFLDREDSPWYPTARLFRQPTRGAWAPVIARVAAELQQYPR